MIVVLKYANDDRIVIFDSIADVSFRVGMTVEEKPAVYLFDKRTSREVDITGALPDDIASVVLDEIFTEFANCSFTDSVVSLNMRNLISWAMDSLDDSKGKDFHEIR